MKLRSILCGMLAIAASVACKPDEVVVTPKLDVDKTAVSVAAQAGEASFNVTSNQDWTASADADWVTVTPNNAKAADKAVAVKITAEDNAVETERTATVTVKAGELSKTVKVTQAAKSAEPTPEPEPEPEVAWGMMGCFVDNQWQSDIAMTKEGEWIVAKGAQFTELTFKIRGNASWDDPTNIGVAPGSERGVVNGKVAVVTAEYAKANLGDDAADIRINGEAGTYDVYFSFENLEVYVMEQGYKPGEKEPQNPDPVEVSYTVVGTIADHAWENNYEGGLMATDGDYVVAKNVPFVWNSTLYGGDYNIIEFKIVETGTWSGYAYPEKNVNQSINTEISLVIGGENIAVEAPEGTYDVYFDKAAAKVWVMTPGYKPGDEVPGGDQPETPAMPEIPADLVAQTIWEGTFESGSWGGMQDLAYGKYDWSVRRPGQYLKFYCGPTDPASQWLMGLRLAATDGWRPVDNLPEFYYQPEGGIVVVELTQELIDLLVQNNGLVVQGDNITLTKIELYRENTGGQESDTINNILVNSDFEDGATGWMGWWNPTYTQAMGEGRNGGNAMELTLGACSALWDAQLLQDIAALEAGVTYAYEFYAKTDSAPLQVQMCAQNPTPPDYPGLYVFAYHDAGTEWTACTGEFVYDGNPASITRIGIQFGKADAVGTKLWIDDFKFGPKK